MKWNSLDELPENGSLVWVKLPGERPLVRLYQNDSFGLGQRDYEVTEWMLYQGQTFQYLKSHAGKPLSIRRVSDHSNPGSSEWSLNLVR